jgi:exodeoxyribonuclease V alpha subunit
LLLDEASMVDLALMRRLLDAVPEHARVIMLGDPDQLASVEAGGVLADLCRAAETPTSPLAPCVSRLVESHRYPAGSGIARLAEAVHASDARGALTLLRSNAHDDVSLAPEIGAGPLPRELIQQAKRGYARLARVSSLESLALLDGFRVLCAHRRGPDGVEALNLALSRVIRGRATSSHESYRGRPILITQNDYATDLFNGDIGVIQAEARQGTLSACFRKGTDVRRVALGRLPAHESVYAMSVHKSQGSEMEEVAIVLPREPSPVVTRELLFTAITRAKRRVTIYASEAVLRHAIEHRTERASGLCDALTS